MDNKIKTGWLDPAGEFYPCAVMQHYAWAAEYLNDIKDAFDDHRDLCGRDAEQMLIEQGWVQITQSFLDGQYSFFWSFKKSLSVYQENYLKEFFEDSEADICPVSRDHWKYDMQ